jgi:hypothetical protein
MSAGELDMLANITFVAALVVMTGCTLYFAPRIKAASVPMQWGFDRRPTWYAPRLVGLWGAIGLVVAVRLLVVALERYNPDKVHNAAYGIILLSIISAVVHAGFLTAVTRWESKR